MLNNSQSIRRALSIRAACAALAVLTAIFVISPRLASAETAPPPALAQKLLAPTAGEGAFDTPFFDAKEAPLSLNALKGQGLVVNFWATWCLPCIKEMPSLDRLAGKLAKTGVRVLAISEDRKPLSAVPAFFEKSAIANLELHYDVKGALSRKLGVDGLPTTVLINAEGVEIGRIKGVVEWDDDAVVDYLKAALAQQ